MSIFPIKNLGLPRTFEFIGPTFWNREPADPQPAPAAALPVAEALAPRSRR